MRDFINKSFQSLFGKYIGVILSAFYSVLLINMLGKENYGLYTVIFLVPTIVASIGSFGLGPSIIYHLNNLNINLLSFFAKINIFGIVISTLYMLLYFLFSKNIINYFNYPDLINNEMIIISLFIIPTLILRKYIRAYLRGLYKIKETVIVENIIYPLFMLVGVLIIYFSSYNFNYFILLPSLGNIVAILSMVYYLKDIFINKMSNNKKFDKAVFYKIFTFSLKGHVGTVLQKINIDLIMLITTPFVHLNEIAMLTLAIKILNIFRGFIDSFLNALAPKIAKTKIENILIIIPRLTRFLSAYLLLIWPLLWLFLPAVIPVVYGDDFSNMHLYIRILLPGITIISLTNIFLMSLTFTGNPKYKTYARLAGFIFSVSFLYLFLNQLGILATLISISSGYLIAAFLSIIFVNKIHKVKISNFLLFKMNDFYYIKRELKNYIKTA